MKYDIKEWVLGSVINKLLFLQFRKKCSLSLLGIGTLNFS